MKKWFGHTDKPVQRWEEYTDAEYMEPEYMESEESGEAGEYYAGEESAEEEYTDAEYVEPEYMESEESGEAGEYYSGEESAEEEYTDAEYVEPEYIGFEESAGGGAYDAEEVYSELEADGVEDPYGEPLLWEGKNHAGSADRGKSGLWGKLQRGLGKMDVIDRLMIGTGAIVLILALVVGGVFVDARIKEKQTDDFASVGVQLEGISVIGEKGLAAVANAQIARMEAAFLQGEDEGKKGYDEAAYDRQISIAPIFTSIQKDLKIKFINQKTGKLVANVPFSVTVTDPAGKSFIWSDDDMDGIIYKKDIDPGKYQVTMEALKDSRYSDYMITTATQTAAVEEKIVYKQVDVANEVKKETEVNVAKEDTKKNETVVESVLTDTVEWVESKVIAAKYSEVSKSLIPNPVTIEMNKVLTTTSEDSKVPGGILRTAGSSGSGEDARTEPGSTAEPTATPAPDATEAPAATPVPDATEAPAATPAPGTTEEPATTPAPGATEEPATTPAPGATEEPATTPAPGATEEPATTPAPGSTAEPKPTESPAPVKGSLSASTDALSMVVGKSMTVTVTTSGFALEKAIEYSAVSSSAGVATASIDNAGKLTVTGVAAGTAAITVTANYEGGAVGTAASAVINVTVSSNKKIVLDKSSAKVFLTEPVVINATVYNAVSTTQPVTAESSNTTVAQVSVSGRTVTVTGIAEGGADITVKYVENGEEVKAVCVVSVKAHPRDDTKTQLKDASDNQLYVLENNVYREAVYADYYKAEKFFMKEDVRYSGWQTIGGKIYYFTAAGDKVTGEQVIQGAKYQFASDGSLVTGDGVIGIDVSKWNGTIDWKAVKNSGVSYVIIRCGYRGSSAGKLIEDPKFETNIKGALAADLKVGVYFYSQAVDEIEAVEEASMVLEQIKNYRISYPVFIDVESSGGRGDKIDSQTRTAVCKAFCQTIQNANYTAGVYSNKIWMEQKINMAELNIHKVWLAQYAASPTYAGKYDIWQYKANGSISGISGNVDLNISYLDY